MNDQQLSALFEEARGRLGIKKGANTIIRVPPLSAAIPVLSTSAPLTTKFRRPCIVLAMYGQSINTTAGLADNLAAAQTELRVQFGGERELVTDGQTPQFAPFLCLFGPNQIAYPLELPGTPGVDWSWFYKNTSGVFAMLPSITMAVIEF